MNIELVHDTLLENIHAILSILRLYFWNIYITECLWVISRESERVHGGGT